MKKTKNELLLELVKAMYPLHEVTIKRDPVIDRNVVCACRVSNGLYFEDVCYRIDGQDIKKYHRGI